MISGTILITGGAGFIGQNLVHFLREHRPKTRVVVVDALTYAANPESLERLISSGDIDFETVDITNLSELVTIFGKYTFDRVVHLAAESHVDRSIFAPDAFVQTNIIGTYNLLKCALDDWRRRNILESARFLHVSTDEVFGGLGPNDPAFNEESSYAPSSPYSASKAASDHLARAFCRTYNLPVLVTNCSNNYGPYQHPEKLIPIMIINALEGRGLPLYGDGLNIRDWLYVRDHCRALWLVLEKGTVGETYNVGGESERTNRDIITAICRLIDEAFASDMRLADRFPFCPAATGRSCETLLCYVADRPGHDRRYAIDGRRLKGKLAFMPEETLDSGLRYTVRWYIENENWWRPTISGAFRDWVECNYQKRVALASN